MPLIDLARERDASISLWPGPTSFHLPPDVEIATDLSAPLAWADFLAICSTPSILPTLRNILLARSNPPIGVHAQILVLTPMPCGVGGCMACAVRARRGWKLTCLDGPVFPLDELAW